MPSVYLAGPISGLKFDEAQKWRNSVRDMLAPDIEAFSPLRSKEFLRSEGALEGAYNFAALSTSRGILTRDHYDCQRCDVVFCNLLHAQRISIGTVMEIAWAHAYRKPLILCVDDDGRNVHAHPMIDESVSYRCPTIQQGVAIVRALLMARSVRAVAGAAGGTRAA